MSNKKDEYPHISITFIYSVRDYEDLKKINTQTPTNIIIKVVELKTYTKIDSEKWGFPEGGKYISESEKETQSKNSIISYLKELDDKHDLIINNIHIEYITKAIRDDASLQDMRYGKFSLYKIYEIINEIMKIS